MVWFSHHVFLWQGVTLSKGVWRLVMRYCRYRTHLCRVSHALRPGHSLKALMMGRLHSSLRETNVIRAKLHSEDLSQIWINFKLCKTSCEASFLAFDCYFFFKSVFLKSRVPIRFAQLIYFIFLTAIKTERAISIQLSVLEKNVHCKHLHDFYEFCRPGNPIPWYFPVFHDWEPCWGHSVALIAPLSHKCILTVWLSSLIWCASLHVVVLHDQESRVL